MTESQHNSDRNEISGERQTIYYLGLGLMVIGFLVFVSTFIGVAARMSGPMMGFGGGPNPGSLFLRALVGMGLMIAGGVLRNVGARGAAGAGVVLDPQQARRDLEPWSRMAGGMLKDAVEESGLHEERGPRDGDGFELPFDEKLRRLEKLRQDGLLNEAEYQQKRAEILSKDW